MKKIGILLLLTLLFTSCPPPIDEALLTFVEDIIAPEIQIDSPSNNSTYRSIINVVGSVSDSAEEM